MGFQHRTKEWLRFAKKGPRVGDEIALVAIDPATLLKIEVPPRRRVLKRPEGPRMPSASGMKSREIE